MKLRIARKIVKELHESIAMTQEWPPLTMTIRNAVRTVNKHIRPKERQNDTTK